MKKDVLITEQHKLNKLLFSTAVTLAVVGGASLLALYYAFAYRKPIVNCDTLSSYKDAEAALLVYPELDKNHDGIPCEEKFNPKKS